jgi:hypothetical protein
MKKKTKRAAAKFPRAKRIADAFKRPEAPAPSGGAFRVQKMAAQGDVLFRKVAALPAGAKLDETKGPIVVAHSETGHHHAIDEASGAKLYRLENDPMVCYLQLAADVEVTHHRPYDTHAPLKLAGPGVFEVKRQREYTPQGFRRVED